MSCNGRFGVIIPDTEEYDGLSVMNYEVNAYSGSDSETLAALQTLAADFSKNNAYGISVAVSGGKDGKPAGADLSFITASDAAAMLRAEKSLELSPLASHPQWGFQQGRSIFYPAAKRQTDYFNYARKITSIPILMNAGIVLVDSDILRQTGLRKFPATWAGFNYLLWKASDIGQPVLGLQTDTDSVVSIIIARGGSILRPVGFNYSLNNPVVNRTLRGLRYIEERNILSVNETNYLNQTMFSFGKLPVVYAQTDGIPHYAELAAVTSPDLDWDAALLPTRKPGAGSVINCTCTAVISDGSPEQELASWLFVKWLTEDEQQIRLSLMTSSLPVVRTAASDILSQNVDGFTRQWLDALRLIDSGHMYSLPSLCDYSYASEGFQKMLGNVMNGEWIWLETFRLDLDIKRKRREERKFRVVSE